MFLVLENSARDSAATERGPAADGPAVAALAERYLHAMFPSETEPGEPQVAAVLEAVARDHFRGEAT